MPEQEPFRIAVLAYRDWAMQAAELVSGKLSRRYEVAVYDYPKAVESGITDPPPRVIFAVGWSHMIDRRLIESKQTATPVLVMHPSPLPLYRGGSPIQNQIIAGEKTSAVTFFELTNASAPVDAGPIFSQRAFPLSGSLSQILDRIRDLSVEGMLSAVAAIEAGQYVTTPQPPGKWSTWSRRRPDDAKLTGEMIEEMTGEQLVNFIRAQQHPYPTVWIEGGADPDRAGRRSNGRRVPLTLATAPYSELDEAWRGGAHL